jgi:hypothetical protein
MYKMHNTSYNITIVASLKRVALKCGRHVCPRSIPVVRRPGDRAEVGHHTAVIRGLVREILRTDNAEGS